MIHARIVLAAGTWDPETASDRIDADYHGRHRRRVTLTTASGREVLLDLAASRHIRDGDAIAADDGSIIRVCASPERLLEITAPDRHHLLRLAWHLGNRHLEVAIHPDRLLIRDDHVIAGMIRGLGGRVRNLEAPFDPETGAYDHH